MFVSFCLGKMCVKESFLHACHFCWSDSQRQVLPLHLAKQQANPIKDDLRSQRRDRVGEALDINSHDLLRLLPSAFISLRGEVDNGVGVCSSVCSRDFVGWVKEGAACLRFQLVQ